MFWWRWTDLPPERWTGTVTAWWACRSSSRPASPSRRSVDCWLSRSLISSARKILNRKNKAKCLSDAVESLCHFFIVISYVSSNYNQTTANERAWIVLSEWVKYWLKLSLKFDSIQVSVCQWIFIKNERNEIIHWFYNPTTYITYILELWEVVRRLCYKS